MSDASKFEPVSTSEGFARKQQWVHAQFDSAPITTLKAAIAACNKIQNTESNVDVQIDLHTAKIMSMCLILELSRWNDQQMSEEATR